MFASSTSHASATANVPTIPDFARVRMESFQRDRMKDAWGGRHILKGRRPAPDAIRLESNDYLALSSHPDIVAAQIAALSEEGNGVMMSGIFLQDEQGPQPRLERRIAADLGAEESILCQSGYAANVGLIQTLAGERTPVYVDMFAHASLWEGVKSAGARPVPVYHNDPDHLERQVLRNGPGVIAVDAVYSTTGSRCPLAEYAAIAKQHGCIFVVDESHSLGTHGARGEGLVASQGLLGEVHFRTVSLAKTYVARAGLILCPREFKIYFGFESMPAIFSSALLPHDLAGIAAAHDVIRGADRRRTRLHAITHRVRSELASAGFNIDNGCEQIIGLEVGTESHTMQVRDALEARGVFGSIFCAPATPKKRSILRLTLHAGLSDRQIDRLIAACLDIREETDLAAWSSTWRANRSGSERSRLDQAA